MTVEAHKNVKDEQEWELETKQHQLVEREEPHALTAFLILPALEPLGWTGKVAFFAGFASFLADGVLHANMLGEEGLERGTDAEVPSHLPAQKEVDVEFSLSGGVSDDAVFPTLLDHLELPRHALKV